MISYKAYNEVPADELVTLGVMEVLRTPADGTDRNTWIRWDVARLAVAANIDNYGEGDEPHHDIVVVNADEEKHSISFSTREHNDGSISVATVSGGHREGRAALNKEQAAAFRGLVRASIMAGLKFQYSEPDRLPTQASV